MSRSNVVAAPVWQDERLEADREKAIEAFREERIREPLEKYMDIFERHRDAFDLLLETTADLTKVSECAFEILTDPPMCEALRYLGGPPISIDDLKVLAQAQSMTPQALRAEPEVAKRIVDTVMMGLDRHRFPWVPEGREATERERASAVLASTALLASRRVETDRRTESKNVQEARVQSALLDHGMKQVLTRTMTVLGDAPAAGEFCMESLLGTRKADIVLRLWDRRVMPIECKVSNSATNSIKRLNNDAAVKAKTWRKEFGEGQVVPTALLSGVYKLKNLKDAQDDGLTIVWAHSLGELLEFIGRTRST